MNIIEPLFFAYILRDTAFVQRHAPLRFVSSTSSQSFWGISIMKPSRATPALFTRMSDFAAFGKDPVGEGLYARNVVLRAFNGFGARLCCELFCASSLLL